VLDAIVAHPQQFRALMCPCTSTLTADFMEATFHPQLSEPGSNRRAAENIVYTWWLEFLQDAEGWFGMLRWHL